jgi:hypothetical protein
MTRTTRSAPDLRVVRAFDDGSEPARLPPTGPGQTGLLEVGPDVYLIYGDEQDGWSIDEKDLSPQIPTQFRYDSLEELFFALVNLNVGSEGCA